MRHTSVRSRLTTGLLALAPAAACADAVAVAVKPLDISVDATVGATDNAGADPADSRRADALVQLRPRLRYVREGAGFSAKVDASVALDGSLLGREAASARPDIVAGIEAASPDRWLTVPLDARLRQTETDPFGPRAEDDASNNHRTEKMLHWAPALAHEFRPGVRFALRRDDRITLDSSGTSQDLAAHSTDLRVERDPKPLGAGVEIQRLDSELRGESLSKLTLESARADLRMRWTDEFDSGAAGGLDRTRTALGTHDDALEELSLGWHPTPRTDLVARIDHRFYGEGGELSLHHRTPWLSLVLGFSREPAIVTQTVGSTSGDATLAQSLDAMLTTRYPDPQARAALVDTLIRSRGLDGSAVGPVDVAAGYPQILTQTVASAAWQSPRTVVSVDLYVRTARVLRRGGDPVSAIAVFGEDTRQAGGEFQASRRLTPTLTLNVLGRLSRIAGLGDAAGNVSNERLGRLWLASQVAPRTSVTSGLQFDRFTTTAPGQHDISTAIVFAGFSEQF